MTTKIRSSRIREFFGVIGSAVAVSAAIENGRQAKASDLQRLGIEPAEWNRIGR